MPKRENKANDLFLLMLNLSQVSLKEKIIEIFLEAIKEIWQNITITFKLSYSEKENTIIELSSASSHYGFISIHNFSELKYEDQDLLHNACGMLSVILKKNEHEELIADEKLLLEKLVEERTQHLNKENIDRKRAEESLRESEERFRAIASHTPDHILMQDCDLRYQMVINPQLGLTEADMLGKTETDFLAPADAEKLLAVKGEVLATGQPVHIETSLQNLKGETEFFEGSYIPKFDSTGKTDGLIGYFQNITERKKAEEEKIKAQKIAGGT